jgi:saccharopine dehydrogenase-like NADP-dependent oxidoreductase
MGCLGKIFFMRSDTVHIQDAVIQMIDFAPDFFPVLLKVFDKDKIRWIMKHAEGFLNKHYE